MGWEGPGAGPQVQGKRIRPLLTLLTCSAAGGDWRAALPAAAAVELLHNFSLIHDDIQDNSPLRRGRPTVWKMWGIPQAINAGDSLYTLAYSAIQDLAETTDPATTLTAGNLLQQTCLALTRGQFLDIDFENRSDVSLEEYWLMIDGKTAALIGASTELGALSAGAAPAKLQTYRKFGHDLGLAFQVTDDLLGIWGDEDETGKSASSDLSAGKKSLPIVYGLGRGGEFAGRWQNGRLDPKRAADLAGYLEREGARQFTRKNADELTGIALGSLEALEPHGEAGVALFELTHLLLKRTA